MLNHFFFILIILVVVLLIKLYLDNQRLKDRYNVHGYDKFGYGGNGDSKYEDNADYDKMLKQLQNLTAAKINSAVEAGYKEGFQSMNPDMDMGNSNSNSNSNSISNSKSPDTIVSYLNKTNIVKLMLFYKIKCSYCSQFLPIWYQIINNLPNTATYEEIDCDNDIKKANEYKISTVPTLILLVNNEQKIYMGDRSYKDILRFLRNNGVNPVERTFEEFDSTGYSNAPDPTAPVNAHCPAVTFDKQLELAKDNYMFQIFNSDGQYGYAVGGNNNDKLFTPFTAAYSTVDSYLSSLPDVNNAVECASLYATEIRGFGLCDDEQLNNMLQYQEKTLDGSGVARFDGTDYSTNKNVTDAIKAACTKY